MGGKESKCCTLNYDEAVKRVSKGELQRLHNAFKRAASITGTISEEIFLSDVLGNGIPRTLGHMIFEAVSGGSSRGLGFRDLLCFLVLITKGKRDEKTRFLFLFFANENGTEIEKHEFLEKLRLCQEHVKTQILSSLFLSKEQVDYGEWKEWLNREPESLSLSKWLLVCPPTVGLSDESELPTFYQTVSGVTHLDEKEVLELEKCFWALRNGTGRGGINLSYFETLVSPPLPLCVVPGIFMAFDENRDGELDFKEVACGVSAACRGPLPLRLKFEFKVFDRDEDGVLNREEVMAMAQCLVDSTYELDMRLPLPDVDEVIEEVWKKSDGSGVSYEQFLLWAVESSLAQNFLQLLSEVCHIVLGLRPVTKEDEKKIVINWLERERKRTMTLGEIWYLVNADWWRVWDISPSQGEGSDSGDRADSPSRSTPTSPSKVKAYSRSPASSPGLCRRSPPPPASVPMACPGAIDNSPLVAPNAWKVSSITSEGGKLKENLVQDKQFILVPDALWKALSSWYGFTVSIPRKVIQNPKTGQLEIELHPLHIRLLRHHNQQSSLARNPTNNESTPWNYGMMAGYGGTIGMSYVPALGLAPRKYLAYMGAFSQMCTVKELEMFLSSRLHIRREDLRVWLVRDDNNMVLLEDEEKTLDAVPIKGEDQILIEMRNKDLTWPEEMSLLRKPQRSSSVFNQLPPVKGATGLSNLGNTCFMNAALQSVSNTKPLTLYFTSGMHLHELNRENPMGMKGHIAKRYGDLIEELWSGQAKSIAPLKLRWTIGKFAPRFTGYYQHDSQELLEFLLDGLHEDLNRVRDRVAIEPVKDSADRPDIEVAEEAWEKHILQNKSIVVDLFQGQLRSKVTCQVCGHVSLKFDPFTVLSLPLPLDSYLRLEVIVIHCDGSMPIKYGVRLLVPATYSSLKEKLAQRTSIPTSHFVLVTIQSGSLQRRFRDDEEVGSLLVYAYDVPVSGKKGTDIDEERDPRPNGISVPVNHVRPREDDFVVAYHRKMGRNDTYFLGPWGRNIPQLFGVPILIPWSEDLTHADLYKAVWVQVSRFISPPPVISSSLANHAQDCDDSMGYDYPFILKAVSGDGTVCSLCPWYRFCRGCPIPYCDADFSSLTSHVAIDWDPSALHLRYQASIEQSCKEDESVLATLEAQNAPIKVEDCLEAFTREEHLNAECSQCKKEQKVSKRLEIWRLPPILIMQVKRFHLVNNRWVKSQKMVQFPLKHFDPTHFLASVPRSTVQRHMRELQDPHESLLEIDLGDGEGAKVTWEGKSSSDRRKRLDSVTKCNVNQGALQDFHQHRLVDHADPFFLKYNLYSVVCHTGSHQAGHYITYALNLTGTWFLFNDSACREVKEEDVMRASPYMLFYERENLDFGKYMPTIAPGRPTPDVGELDSEMEADIKKYCSIM